MRDLYTVSYQDFIQELRFESQSNDVTNTSLTNHRWGNYEEKITSLGPITMFDIHADLNKDFKIQFTDEHMNNAIHFCSTLHGNIRGSFCDDSIEGALKDSEHHYIYAPDAEYSLAFKNLHVLHLAIDRSYFMNLVDGNEEWMKELRTDLNNQQVVRPGGLELIPGIRRVLSDLLQPTLTGNLRNMMLEAKVIELIALQLDQYRNEKPEKNKWKKKDEETFHAIHEHLTKTFAEDHSLQSLAREFGINEFKLKQGFRQYFGTTVFDFIFGMKMNHAKHLITEKGMYLNEVSRQIGYKNPNHFSTAFKKKFGFSPNTLKN